MSMSVNLHSNRSSYQLNRELFVKTKISDDGSYATVGFDLKENGFYTNEITLFIDEDQAKAMHKELTKLMKQYAARDKRTKEEKHANNITNSKAQKFSHMALTDDLPF